MGPHAQHGLRGLGMEGVTRAPPEGWAETPRKGLGTLSKQQQHDVFLLFGPAADVSVLKPGGHMVLLSIWEEHRDESEIPASLFYELGLYIRWMYLVL